jgi:MoaA/NifB/PqqE/SkfB family radical SAM enzyme
MENLRYIKSVKKSADKLTISFVFLMTTKNIDDLPAFIDFAKEYRVDGVIAYYNYVYRKDQKDISCCFAKERTNSVIDTVREKLVRDNSGFRVSLPPKFNEEKYNKTTLCGEAWSQVMINSHGDIITCDVAGDSRETLKDKDFMEVWNGKYFLDIRKMLLAGDRPCSKYCFRANSACVNDFRSHIITRGKTEEEIQKFLEQ